ncbi:MAG: ribosome-binding factor A [Deltaproteobacteria bacterium RBG_13_65_10]|nr:MAG: ribosome-binding factor A [Deltaproteobacteria bacterium RBG_13_65_10]
MIPKRLSRVGEAVRGEIGGMLLRDLKDPRIGFVTITDVVMSPDLRHAKVYFSRLGTDAEREESLQGLTAAAGWIRRELGQRLDLKFAPEIRFYHDESLDAGVRIDRLLKEIKRPE